MSYVKAGQGKPSTKERALFAASVVFTYGIWENYVEQLALELAGHVATIIRPENVPEEVKKVLEKKTAWELAISPGWKELWLAYVREKAIGDDSDKFGMNTARAGQVKHLLSLAGVKNAFDGVEDGIAPPHLDSKKRNAIDAVEALVTLRGEIVHTGKVPDELSKGRVIEWRGFIEQLTKKIDASCRTQCQAILS
ncbi:HEPN domain-containing protein [Montanilutibacter psychrotolerans]|nr:HEPN domain-containing protein [Lysobacter psychrotolerans]